MLHHQPPGTRRPDPSAHTRPFSPRTLLMAVVVALLLVLAGCGGTDTFSEGGSQDSGGGDEQATASGEASGSTSAESAHGQVVIGAQQYTEMLIMANMYAALLADAGYEPTIKPVQTRDLYAPPLKAGKIDVVPEYAASLTEYLNKQIHGPDAEPAASPDIDKTMQTLQKLAKKWNITPLDPSKAQNTNAYAVTEEFAKKHDVSTLSELGKLDMPIVLAAAPDCPKRHDCKQGLESVYGINITRVEPLGFGTTQTKNALKSGEVQLGQVGTTDGSLDKLGLVILDDDKNLQKSENLLPVVNTAFLEANPEVADSLNQLSAVLTTEDLTHLNAQVDVKRKLPKKVARSYLKEQGLL